MKRGCARTSMIINCGCILSVALLAALPATTVAADRVVICEEFTATWCGYCADVGPIFGQLIDNYPDTFAFVQIHHGDSYATGWGNARANFYTDFSGYPTSYFDGGLILRVGAHNYATLEGDYLDRRADLTDVTMELGGVEVGAQTYDITVEVCIEEGGTAKTMRIYMVELLDNWPSSCTWCRTGFRQAATTQDVTLSPGECVQVTRTFTFDSTSWANQSDIRMVAWAQEPQSSSPPSNRAEIYQGVIEFWPLEPLGAPNDMCEMAINLTNEDYANSTELATNDGDASCGDASDAPDVWFRYRAPATGVLRVDSCTSAFDTVLSAHTDCPQSGGTEIVCNDDSDFCMQGSNLASIELAVEEGLEYVIRLAGHAGDVGEYVVNFDGPIDITPPTPDPMTFDVAPVGAGAGAVEMTATEAYDNGSPAIEYYFNFVEGGAGGADSGWISEQSYTQTELTPNAAYTYQVKARDGSDNETAYSDSYMAYTGANTPERPIASNIGGSTMDLEVDPNGNPAYTEFTLSCAFTQDDTWNLKYIGLDGYPTDTPVWMTAADWGTFTVRGLSTTTLYCWRCQARNEDGVATDWSAWRCVSTTEETYTLGDLNCDGAVDFDDISPFVTALSGESAYNAAYPDCEWLNADCNQDGTVDFDDISAFVALLSGK